MLIVDTSAVVEVLVAREPDASLVARLGSGDDLHAPHLLDVEVLSALRGLVRGGGLSIDRATDALADFERLLIVRYPHRQLAHRIWELRDNLTAYDAAFVALAEAAEAPLITCDHRLKSAAGSTVAVEWFPVGDS